MSWPPAPAHIRTLYDPRKQELRQNLRAGYAKVDMGSISDERLSHGAVRLHALLCRWCDWDGLTFPSVGDLADRLCVHPRTITRWLKELVAHGAGEVYALGPFEPLVYERAAFSPLPRPYAQAFAVSNGVGLDTDVQSDRLSTSGQQGTPRPDPQRTPTPDKEDKNKEDQGRRLLSSRDPLCAEGTAQQSHTPGIPHSVTAAALLDSLLEGTRTVGASVHPRYRRRAQDVMRRWLESGVDSTEIARSIDVFVSSLHGSQQSSIAVFDAFLDYIYAGSGPGNLMRNELNWLMHDRRRWNVYTGDGGRRRRDLREAIEWIQINRQLWSAQVEMAAYDSVRGEFLIRAVGLAARTDLDDDASLRRYVGTTLGVSDRDARIFVEGEACGEILDIVTARLVDAIRSEFSDFEKAYRRQRAEPVADSSAAPGHRAG